MRGKPKKLGSPTQSIEVDVKTPLVKSLIGRTENQKKVIRAIYENDIVLVNGSAGSGKSYLAVGAAAVLLEKGKVDKIYFCRPAIEASGEKLGFLPGSDQEKIGPYMLPLVEALLKFVEKKTVDLWMKEGKLEFVPLAFLRGRNIEGILICDEAQNITYEQAYLILTRMCEGAKIVMVFDPYQSDLPRHLQGAVETISEEMKDVEGVGVVQMTAEDVQRHPLVKEVISAYERIRNRRQKEN